MKRWLLFLALALLVIPFVSSAENDITLSRDYVQLGDRFVVDGDNIQFNGADFTGNAMIKLNGPEEEYTLLTQVIDGGFSSEAAFCLSGCLLPGTPGNYTVSVVLLNSKLVDLEEILVPDTLVVDGKLNIIVELDQVQINPGETIELKGSVQRNSDSAMVDNGAVKLYFDEVEYETSISSEKFSYEFTTSNDIASNYHDVDITSTDEYGNYGEATVQFFVVGVAQALSINFDKEEYQPGDNVEITVALSDQADADLSDDIELRIYNGKNRRVFKEVILANEQSDFPLDEYAVPGEWNVIAKGAGLKLEKTFEVPVVETLDIKLSGQYLEITNTGNVDYSNPLIIKIDDDKTIEKRTNLAPGENLTLVLYKDVSDGKHKVYVENTDQTFEVEIVDNRGFGDKIGDFFSSITGQAVRKSGSGTSNAPFLILVILIVGLLVFISVKLRMGKNFRVRFPKFGKRKKAVAKPSSKGDDIEEIRQRILQDIESSKVDKKKENNFSVNPIIGSTKEEEKPKRFQFDEPMRRDEPKSNGNKNHSNLFKLFD